MSINLYYHYNSSTKEVHFSNQLHTNYVQFVPGVTGSVTGYKDALYVVADESLITMPENISAIFYNCSKLTEINLSGWNTQFTTDMSYMFQGCTSLVKVEIPRLPMDNVTTLYQMFRGCTSLTSVNMKYCNTPRVSDTYCMFYGCTKLTKIDMSNFSISSLKKATMMFYYCPKLSGIIVKKDSDWSTKSFDSSNMFGSCSSLPNWDSSTVNKQKAYSNGDGKGYLTASGSLYYQYDTENTTVHFSNMMLNENYKEWEKSSSSLSYQNATKVITDDETLTLPQNISYLFANCSKLQQCNVSNWDTSEVQDISNCFLECTSLTEIDVSMLDTHNISNMQGMFNFCKVNLLDLSNWDVSCVTSMDYMFSGASNLSRLDLTNWILNENVTLQSMFLNCTNLSKIIVGTSLNWNDIIKSSPYNRMFSNCSNLPNYVSHKVDLDMAYAGGDGKGYFITNLYYWYDAENQEVHFSNVKEKKQYQIFMADSSYSEYRGAKNVVTDPEILILPLSISRMFYGCSELQNIDLSNWNSSGVQWTRNVFADCTNLKFIDLSSWNTDQVMFADEMFRGCTNLKTVDLRNWFTKGIADVEYLFDDCTHLSNIIVKKDTDWSDYIDRSAHMFINCISLPHYNDSITDKRGAYEGLKGSIYGYFTPYKWVGEEIYLYNNSNWYVTESNVIFNNKKYEVADNVYIYKSM